MGERYRLLSYWSPATIFFPLHSISFQITNPRLQPSLFSWQFWIRNIVPGPRIGNFIRQNMLLLLCERAGKQVEKDALGPHRGHLPRSDVLPGGNDKDTSLLFRAQPEKAWWTRGDQKSKFRHSKDSLLVPYTHTKLGHLFFWNPPQSCPHGQLYIDETTLGFGISLYIWKHLIWNHIHPEKVWECCTVLVICTFPKVSMGDF